MLCTQCGAELGTNTTCPVCGRTAYYKVVDRRTFDPVHQRPFSGWWQRVGATVMDALVLIVPSLILRGVISDTSVSTIAGALLSMGYQVFLLSSHRGQTVGNMVVKTCVIRAQNSGGPISLDLTQSFLRWAYLGVPTVIVTLLVGSRFNDAVNYIKIMQQSGIVVTANNVPHWVQQDLLDTVAGFGLLFLYFLADILSPLWTQRRQTLHDIVARTVVVQAN